MNRRSPFLAVVLLALAVVAAVPVLTGNDSLRESLFLVLMAITLATSVNIIIGFAGYVSFGNIVFFGIGGYASFWLMGTAGVHFVPAALLGVGPAVALAVVIGIPVLRLRGAYFALATIGINEAVRTFMANAEPLGAAVGMYFSTSAYAPYGGPRGAAALAYAVMALITLVAVAAAYAVKTSKFGLALMTIREDQDVATVVGINPARAKLAAYAISAVFPALAGAAFFFKNGIIEPSSAFDLNRSIESLVMVALGGIGTITGPILGATLYQWLRAALITNPVFANIQMFVSGLLLLLVVLFAPGGLVGLALRRIARLRGVIE